MIEAGTVKSVSTLAPEELLGRLNDIERKYAPHRLYVAGKYALPLPRPRVAIVGSRKASEAGLKTANTITKIMVRSGVTVVSGLAAGIDTEAHTTAIGEGGRTIAVLGTPLDRFYPAQNARLQETIMSEHCAVSQFRLGDSVQRKNFVIRNRTMALISNASVIIEGDEDSGTRHQGWEALRLGRPLYLWHPLLKDRSVTWPRKLLDYGAIELTEPEAVLENLPPPERVLVA
ncbi:MAG: DNA-processing protein DprA [Nitrososphaerota archaeon]|nr:DNA-processing protein DprA [Nitrososphaerota archaeon]